MNPEVKSRWIAALESGDYTQGRGALRSRDNDFCCLGVLCDLAAKDGVGDWIEPSSMTGDARFETRTEVSDALPPFEVLVWAGLDNENGTTVTDGEGTTSLADINDNRGANFERIAELIEEYL